MKTKAHEEAQKKAAGKAVEAMRAVGVGGTVKNMGSTKHRAVKKSKKPCK